MSGSGYGSCRTVYFFFDGVRIGIDAPDAGGVVRASGLSVPGDADAGPHQVTASCSATGRSPLATTTFVVTSASAHRSAFVTSLAQPRHIATDARSIATSAIAAILLALLLAFPCELFNSTLEENYDEVRGWFRMPKRAVHRVTRWRRDVSFLVMMVLGGVVYGLLSPDFGLNLSTVALVAGLTVALLVMSLVFSLPADIAIHRQYGEWGVLNVLPGTILVGAVCVAISRLLHFQPGYLYGVLAGLAFKSQLSKESEGRLTAFNWLFGLAICVAAWIARVPVSAAASRPGAGLWLFALETCLVAVFLIGIESLGMAMLPMRFLDGRKVMNWSRPAWIVLFTLGLFAVVHVLLNPRSGYVGHTTQAVILSVLGLYVAFGLVSVAFWAYFRYRPPRPAMPAAAPSGPSQ